MMSRARIDFASSLACVLALAACTASSHAPPASDAGASAAPEDAGVSSDAPASDPRACGPSGPRHHAFLATGTCTDIDGKDGAWEARALFPDAPDPIRVRACSYQWRSSVKATPDVDALHALAPTHLTPNCEPEAALSRGLATIVTEPDGGADGAPTGVTGCDVCGIVEQGRAFVILPHDMLDLHAMVAKTEGGRFVSFALTPPAAQSQAFSVALPAAPDGSAYVSGDVPLFKTSPF